MRRTVSVLSLFLLSACVPTPGAEVSMNLSKAAVAPVGSDPQALPGAQAALGAPAPRSNVDIAQDILDLTFRMESGRAMQAFSRFEGPVTLRLTGDVPASARTDVDRLIGRLRGEAGINLHEVTASQPAAITVEFVPRARIRAAYANVACFVVPRVSGWEEFRQARGTAVTEWTTLAARERLAIFIPSDTTAQEVRDCLHEEVAQALGPINDLYRLSDSVFNDDNFHSVLTRFDMMVLRALYAPELRSGMTRDQVAARLPGVLARVNPAGQRPGGGAPAPAVPRVWTNAIETALGGRGSLGAREQAARQAVATARAQGWRDSRLALSHFALGRLTLARQPEVALAALTEAQRIYLSLPGGAIHAAHVDMQIAAHDLSQGNPAGALARADRAIPIVSRAENAALMATLLMMKAEALDAMGQTQAAQAVRLDSQGWARYGFGSDSQARARAAEIAALARRGSRG
ncbi:MAG TPA: DUF2927 domain-containing protein [Paracoccaceae bacterium]|nr:DUF2927 domain-containing protein [Paracoccaceae bacterium]